MKKIGIKLSAAVVATSLLSVSMVQPVAKASEIVNTDAVYYTYYQGERTGFYTLEKLYPLDSSSSRVVIGADTRYPDYSKTAVCKIQTVGGGLGTGFVLDDHTIVTAAHCVASRESDYTTTSGVVIEKILFYDKNGNVSLTLDEDDIFEAHVPYNYFKGGNDYAAITTTDNILSDYAMFNLSFATDYLGTANPTLYCTGFPGDKGGKAYTGTGKFNKFGGDKKTLQYSIDTAGGQSGGPVYTITNYDGKTYYNVVGIHVSGVTNDHNSATRFTTDVLHFYKNNPYF